MNVVITGGTGAVGGVYTRALVPAGYDVTIVSSRLNADVRVFESLGNQWKKSPRTIEDILTGETSLDPLKNLASFITDVIFNQYNLGDKDSWNKTNPFEKADAVILCSANPNANQNATSAAKNYAIDVNSIDAAIDSKAKIIIYTSSNWRTMDLIGRGTLINPENHEAPPYKSHYAQMKAASVRYLKGIAGKNKEKLFIYNDHCWYPRETAGAPPANIEERALQFWVAECEAQLHILYQLEIKDNPYFQKRIENGENCFGFNVVSKNIPTDSDQPGFCYDLSNSEKLGVKHQFNIYDTLKNRDYSWRKIPIVMS